MLSNKKLRPLIVRKEGDETVDDGTEEVAVVHQRGSILPELYLIVPKGCRG